MIEMKDAKARHVMTYNKAYVHENLLLVKPWDAL